MKYIRGVATLCFVFLTSIGGASAGTFQYETLYHYSGNAMSNGGVVTAEVSLICSTIICPAGYTNQINSASITIYGQTYSYVQGQPSSADFGDLHLVLGDDGSISEWVVQAFADGRQFGTRNRPSTMAYGPFAISDFVLVPTGGSITPADFIERNSNDPGVWFSTHPVPGPIVGAGLPGTLIAIAGFIGWRRRLSFRELQSWKR